MVSNVVHYTSIYGILPVFSYILCAALQLLIIFYILVTRSAFLVHRVILGSLMFHHFGVDWVEIGSDFFSFPTGCHGNYRSIVSLP